MPWREYADRVSTEWTRILSRSRSERTIRRFLEQHPSLLPGAFSFPMSGSYPVRAALITKPPLQTTVRRVPDFMWLAADSATLYPVLIEIETPSKKWFNSRGVPTQQFTQAVSQLREWRAWFNKRNNQAVFMQQFDIPEDFDRGRFRPQFVLIFGRRAEFDERPYLRALRAAHEQPEEAFVTFDRLKPQRSQDEFICIRRRPQWYECVAVPAPLRMNPSVAMQWVDVRGLPQAIRRCEWMTPERRAFLADRIPYWQNWAKRSDKGIINMSDGE
jgi:hypothetical protein